MRLFAILALSLILFGSATADEMSRSLIPAELLGKWSAGAMTAAQSVERDETNDTVSSEKTTIQFNADGTFAFATRLSVQIYGCETSVFNYNPGKFTVTGNLINFEPTDDELIYAAACHPSLNNKQNSPPIKASFSYALKTIDGIETLCLSDGQDLKKCYSRDGEEKGD